MPWPHARYDPDDPQPIRDGQTPLAALINQRIATLSLTIPKTARAAAVSESNLYQIVAGKRLPHTITLTRLAPILDLPVGELVAARHETARLAAVKGRGFGPLPSRPLARFVEERLRVLGLSRAAASRLAGLHKSTLTNIIDRGTGLHVETLFRLADALAVDPCDLLHAAHQDQLIGSSADSEPSHLDRATASDPIA